MATPISSIRNLGPATEDEFRRAGVLDAEQLRELGTDAAYARLLQNGTRPHFIGFYVIEMGLQGRPWNDCKGKEKDRLRARFDALVAKHYNRDLAGFERVLNEIGVVAKPQK